MKQGLEPSERTTCMKCRKRTSRYYGRWGAEGLCRPCVLAMPAEVRRKVVRDMSPADRKRWQLDDLLENPPPERPARAPGAQPGPAASGPETAQGEPQAAPRAERLEAKLEVAFSVAPSPAAPKAARGRTFHASTLDLSPLDLRLAVHDPLLLDLGLGAVLRLTVRLPRVPEPMRCTGAVRNVVRAGPAGGAGHLCVELRPMTGAARQLWDAFLAQRTRSTGAP